jgi:hypothetical protein
VVVVGDERALVAASQTAPTSAANPPAPPRASAFKRAAPKATAPTAAAAAGAAAAATAAAAEAARQAADFFAAADAPPSDAGDADGMLSLEALDGPLGGDAAEDADVEAARQRLAALRSSPTASSSEQPAAAAAAAAAAGGGGGGGRGGASTLGSATTTYPARTPAADAVLAGLPAGWAEAVLGVHAALFGRRGYTVPPATLPARGVVVPVVGAVGAPREVVSGIG